LHHLNRHVSSTSPSPEYVRVLGVALCDLFRDYRRNVALYGAIQNMFREHRFPTLIVWGKYDVFFTQEGAKAYLRDLPDAELHWLDAGHFALETHHTEIILRMRDFLRRVRAADSLDTEPS
jgi:pimeloyl-ACP methyl ester carboxylesterase